MVQPWFFLKPLDAVTALDPGGRPPPGTAGYPVLVGPESGSVMEPFVHLPYQWVIGLSHREGDAAGFPAGKRHVTGKMLDDGGKVVVITAYKLAAEMNVGHGAILPYVDSTTRHDGLWSGRASMKAVVLNSTHAHYGRVGIKDRRHPLALALCLLVLLGGITGCSYDYPEPERTPTAGASPATISVHPYNNMQILEQEADNYAELGRLLRTSPGPVLLYDVGPLDGPLRGFGKFEEVPAAGQYTVTAACVGASSAKIFIGQEYPGAAFQPVELTLDCAGATSQVMAFQQGYVFAHLFLPGPGDTPWTGAVGGVRVTGTG